jgi:hypothetical protein
MTTYSSAGRAGDCSSVLISLGPWFDSGWVELFDFPLSVPAWCYAGLGLSSQRFRGSIVVSIPACHAGDPGSIPGLGVPFRDPERHKNELTDHLATA